MNDKQLLEMLNEILDGTKFDDVYRNADGLNDAKYFGHLDPRYSHQLTRLREVRDQIKVRVEREQTT